jgi:membrane peptidoglycan carboxypeptidase
MRQGYSVESLIETPGRKVFADANDGGDWDVKGGCCDGVTTLAEATAHSSNTAYAEMMLELGPEAVIDMAHQLGVKTEFPEAFPAIVLGAGEVSVLDMAAGYSTFANQGVRVDTRVITRVEDANGNVIEEFTPQRTQVLDVDQASRVTYALEQVIDHGTGEAADIGRPAAGKTGTTTDYADAWFVGYTPTLTAAAWMGYTDGNRPMTDRYSSEQVSGGGLPAQMWRRFMELVLADTPVEEFPPPGDLEFGFPWNEDLEELETASTEPSGGGDVPDEGSVETTPTPTDSVPSTDSVPATEPTPTDPVVPTEPTVPATVPP